MGFNCGVRFSGLGSGGGLWIRGRGLDKCTTEVEVLGSGDSIHVTA